MPSLSQDIRRLAIPAMISNISVPLLALVDTAIVGHLGQASHIGAVAVGAVLINTLLWGFGFLRMGTGGLTAQAYGRSDHPTCVHTLLRSLMVAMGLAVLLLVAQWGIVAVAFDLMRPTPVVAEGARLYFSIVVWGVPASLALYVFTGWFVGMQNGRYPMYVALLQNVVNIALSFAFVYGFGWGVAGVAWGTVGAQYVGLAFALWLYAEGWGHEGLYGGLRQAWHGTEAWRALFVVNRDIFLRTLCLMAVTLSFTTIGTRQGEDILAANALLLQFFMLFSYVMDGYAYAGEALAGRFMGARDRTHFDGLVRTLFRLGGYTAMAFTLFYIIGGKMTLHLLTDHATVRQMAMDYLPWTYAIPAVSFAAFLYDGLYIGTTSTRGMLQSMVVAMLLFFITFALLHPSCGNHALWVAQLVYLGVRGAVQRLLFSQVRQKVG